MNTSKTEMLVTLIKGMLEKNPSMSVTDIADTLISSMEGSDTIVGKPGSNNNDTIKRAIKRAFGYERKIKQSKR